MQLQAEEEEGKQHPKKVVFEKVEFDSDPEYVIIEEAITMVGPETAVNIQSNVKKSIPNNALINIELNKEKAKDEFNLVVKSGDVAVCGLLRNATGQPMFKPIITKLLELTNLPQQCPFPVVSSGWSFARPLLLDTNSLHLSLDCALPPLRANFGSKTL